MCDQVLQKYKDMFIYRTKEDLMKKSCFILGVINAAANAGLFVSSVYVEYRALTYRPPPSSGFLLGGIRWGRTKRDAIDDHIRNEGWFPTLWVIMIITAAFSLATCTLSTLLCYGIRKRRPGFVQLYFVYGATITIVTAVICVIHLCIDETPGLGIGGLFGCVIHSVYLVLVYKTFKTLQAELRHPQPVLLQQVEFIPSAPPLEFIEDEESYPTV